MLGCARRQVNEISREDARVLLEVCLPKSSKISAAGTVAQYAFVIFR